LKWQDATTPDHPGLRLIAIFEAVKGALVLAVGLALLGYLDRDLETFTEDLVRHLHLNPAHGLAKLFITSAGHVPDSQMHLLTLAAVLYALVRFVEAFGLWKNRAWAEWFALVSCAVYLPVELYELARGLSAPKISLFIINCVVVIYLWYALHDTDSLRGALDGYRKKLPLSRKSQSLSGND